MPEVKERAGDATIVATNYYRLVLTGPIQVPPDVWLHSGNSPVVLGSVLTQLLAGSSASLIKSYSQVSGSP